MPSTFHSPVRNPNAATAASQSYTTADGYTWRDALTGIGANRGSGAGSSSWVNNGGLQTLINEGDLARLGINASQAQGDYGMETNWTDALQQLQAAGYKIVERNDAGHIYRGIQKPDGSWAVAPKVNGSMGNALGEFLSMAALMAPAVGGIVGAAGSAAAPGGAAAGGGATAAGTNVASLAEAISSGLVNPAIGAEAGALAASGGLAEAIPQIVITGSKAAAGAGLGGLGAAAAGAAAAGTCRSRKT